MDIRSLFMKRSTREFIEEGRRTPGYSFFDLLHGYVYLRWPYTYIGIGVGEHRLAKFFAPLAGWFDRLVTRKKESEGNGSEIQFADTYHGKVMPLEPATRLVTIGQEISLPDLEQVIPYKRARAIIMKNPDHIVALECPCRSARANPCLPLDVCLVIGEPFASVVQDHHPTRSRRITQAEAVAILKAEDERGHVHHAFFKDAMLERFYAICNCCSCCCGAMQAQRSGVGMLTSSGYLMRVDEDQCIGCGTCVDTCQFEALTVTDWVSQVDEELCMGCGVCVSKCDQGALSLELSASKGLPLEICALMQTALPAE